ncbi:MAG: hypothetical protein JOY60_06050 [Burkholderiaceae bacterium]|nr:hypothetical protein [Burkholderiaceae bacterium]
MLAPTVLDLEASGFGRGSYPIEVGFVDAQGAVFCSLIRPMPDWMHWDDEAQALHGISRQILLEHGKPSEWVARELNHRLQGQQVYCDAWGHDYPWLSRLFDAAGLVPSFQLCDLRQLLSEDDQARWDATADDVRRRLAQRRHRASADARVIQETWLALRSPQAHALG